jgi:hypothetical protein
VTNTMTNTLRFSIIFVALAGSTALRAADVKWDDLCEAGRERELSLTSTDGKKSKGPCYRADPTAISLKTNHGLQTVDRGRITAARLDNLSRSHCTEAALFLMVVGPLLFSQGDVLEAIPLTPLGLAAGAAVSPFCAVYDLVNRLTGSHKITII